MFHRLHAIADALVLTHGWRRLALAFGAGVASALAMPPLFVAPILLVTLSVLVLLLDAADADPPPARRRLRLGPFFAVGWWFGFGFFLAGLYWIAEALLVNASAHGWLIPFALLFIPGGLAVFPALACLLAGRLWSTGFARIGILAACLTVAEFARGFVLTGFPWNGFHHALGLHDALLQGFALVGPHAAHLLVVLVAMLPAAFWPRGTAGRGGVAAALMCVLMFAGWTGYGAWRLTNAADRTAEGPMVRIVQPNIPQDEKWDPRFRERNFSTLMELTTQRTGPDQLGALGATRIVWPESAFPFLLSQRPDALATIGAALPLGTHLLAGAVRSEPLGNGQRAFTNAIFTFNDRGEVIDAYDKARLVPFGEMLPFSDLIDRIGLRPLVSAPAGFIPGPGPDQLQVGGGLSALALICYEAIFPHFVRAGLSDARPDVLLNVTNDAWFGTSAGPHQHFFQARLRAVETGVPMIRAANTGVSAVVDGYGRVQESLDLGTRGVIDALLPADIGATYYVTVGEIPFTFALAMILVGSFRYRRVKKPVFT